MHPVVVNAAKRRAFVASAIEILEDVGLDGLDEDSIHGLKIISRGTAILLLFVYIAYLVFQVGVLRACGSEAFLTAITHLAQDTR